MQVGVEKKRHRGRKETSSINTTQNPPVEPRSQKNDSDNSIDLYNLPSAKMATQTALRLTGRDSWEQLAELQEPRPTAGKHEVLIKVRGVALNFRDIAISTSKYPFQVKDQVIPGSDAAGDIVTVGEGVTGFKAGDKVVVSFDQATQYGPIKTWENGLGGPIDGVLREYISVPAHTVVKIPENSTLSYAQWASVVCTGVTAWNSLFGVVAIKPGQSVLFQGTFSSLCP
jgi:NADPH:quinone reductase-like Zn-dependent oxidoreductase